MKSCGLPLALIIQPFAAVRGGEDPIPVVEFGQDGPPRCTECQAYVNAWCVWTMGGQRWVCNLCGTENPGKLWGYPFYLCTVSNYNHFNVKSRPYTSALSTIPVVGLTQLIAQSFSTERWTLSFPKHIGHQNRSPELILCLSGPYSPKSSHRSRLTPL